MIRTFWLRGIIFSQVGINNFFNSHSISCVTSMKKKKSWEGKTNLESQVEVVYIAAAGKKEACMNINWIHWLERETVNERVSLTENYHKFRCCHYCGMLRAELCRGSIPPSCLHACALQGRDIKNNKNAMGTWCFMQAVESKGEHNYSFNWLWRPSPFQDVLVTVPMMEMMPC